MMLIRLGQNRPFFALALVAIGISLTTAGIFFLTRGGEEDAPASEPLISAEPSNELMMALADLGLEIVAGDVLVFQDASCQDCATVKRLLPLFLENRGVDAESVRFLDVGDARVVRLLLAYEKTRGFRAPALAPVVITEDRVYRGVEEFESAIGG